MKEVYNTVLLMIMIDPAAPHYLCNVNNVIYWQYAAVDRTDCCRPAFQSLSLHLTIIDFILYYTDHTHFI